MNNLYNVNFKTDLALYEKFRLISTIKKDKLQNVLTQLIENYVTKNERFIANPAIQEEIQPTEPKMFGEQDEWNNYYGRSDKNTVAKIITRTTFHRYLANLYLIDRDNESELKQTLQDPNFFLKTEDGKFLQARGIISAVNGMSSLNNLSPIRVV